MATCLPVLVASLQVLLVAEDNLAPGVGPYLADLVVAYLADLGLQVGGTQILLAEGSKAEAVGHLLNQILISM